MKDKLTSARFIVTLALTITFCVMCVRNAVNIDVFNEIYKLVIIFYFLRKREEK